MDFTEPVAPLANLDKRLTSGIAISPAFAGKWTWLGDKQLRFTPVADWPVDASFTVKLARRGFLAKTAELDDYSFQFKTAPFSAKITNSQFYQDPQNPALKSLVATVSFSHPVDRAQFESHVSLVPAKDADFLGLTPDSRHFTVVYDRLNRFAYIHSATLGMPRDDTSIAVVVEKGIRAARGGNQTGSKIQSVVTIPGRDVPGDILAYAREHNISHVVVGNAPRRRLFGGLRGNITTALIARGGDIPIHVVGGVGRAGLGAKPPPEPWVLQPGPYLPPPASCWPPC